MVKERKANKKEVPVGVKIISVFYCLSAIFGLIFLITQFIQAGLEAITLFVGIDLWKRYKLSRIVAIILSALGVVLSSILLI